MKVVGIAGSPRPGANTETLLESFLAGARSAGAVTEKIAITGLQLKGCIACDGCLDDGLCVIEDDFQALREMVAAADVIALSAPLYFGGLPARAKAMVDRFQCQWAQSCVLKRPLPAPLALERRRGVLLCVGGRPRPDFEGIRKSVKPFFMVNEIEYWGELLVGGVDGRRDIERQPDALDKAFELGARAVSGG